MTSMMDNPPMKKPTLILLAALVSLSGCSLVHRIRHTEPAYKQAQEENPLEIPPGLDTPPNSEALSIPSVDVNGNPVGPQSAPQMAPTGGSVAGGTISLSDDVDSAYRRVGLALDRAGVGTVTAHDDSAHTYQIAVNSTVTTEPQGGFFHRILHRSHTETVTGAVTVAVSAQGSGSAVNVSGDPSAVQRVVTALQQRLGVGG